jgi:hypothetical protein
MISLSGNARACQVPDSGSFAFHCTFPLAFTHQIDHFLKHLIQLQNLIAQI